MLVPPVWAAGGPGFSPTAGRLAREAQARVKRMVDHAATGVPAAATAVVSPLWQASWAGDCARAVTAVASSTPVRSTTSFGTAPASTPNWST